MLRSEKVRLQGQMWASILCSHFQNVGSIWGGGENCKGFNSLKSDTLHLEESVIDRHIKSTYPAPGYHLFDETVHPSDLQDQPGLC